MMILWLRFLDWLESTWRQYWKVRRLKRIWGDQWEDKSRTGRVYSRVNVDFADGVNRYQIRPEPGWLWTCQNCKTTSLIRESDMPAVLAHWETLASGAAVRGFKVPPVPKPWTAGCPECRFRPGAPE